MGISSASGSPFEVDCRLSGCLVPRDELNAEIARFDGVEYSS